VRAGASPSEFGDHIEVKAKARISSTFKIIFNQLVAGNFNRVGALLGLAPLARRYRNGALALEVKYFMFRLIKAVYLEVQ